MKILLTEKEAAQYLSLSVHTLRRWRLFSQGPSFTKLGSKAVRYPIAGLDEFIHGDPSSKRKGA